MGWLAHMVEENDGLCALRLTRLGTYWLENQSLVSVGCPWCAASPGLTVRPASTLPGAEYFRAAPFGDWQRHSVDWLDTVSRRCTVSAIVSPSLEVRGATFRLNAVE